MGVEDGKNGPELQHVTWPDNDELIRVQADSQRETEEDVFGDADEMAQLTKEQVRGQMSRLGRWRAERADRKEAAQEARRAVELSAQDFKDLKPEDPADAAMWDEPIPGTESKPALAADAAPTYTKEDVENVDWDEKF